MFWLAARVGTMAMLQAGRVHAPGRMRPEGEFDGLGYGAGGHDGSGTGFAGARLFELV